MTTASTMRELISDKELEDEIAKTLQRLADAQQPLNTNLAITLPMQTHLVELLKIKRDRLMRTVHIAPAGTVVIT